VINILDGSFIDLIPPQTAQTEFFILSHFCGKFKWCDGGQIKSFAAGNKTVNDTPDFVPYALRSWPALSP